MNNKNVQFVIVTNGSYKTKAWWQELDTILNEKDHIHFSLDGWDQRSNNIYRVNCHWDSIMKSVLNFKTKEASVRQMSFREIPPGAGSPWPAMRCRGCETGVAMLGVARWRSNGG